MPSNRFEKNLFAFLTVLITVHAYIFYSLYVINGEILMTVNKSSSVLAAISNQGGVYILGRFMPIWAVVLIEFLFAVILEIAVGSPLSFKAAVKIADPKKCSPLVFETAIICSTVMIMCPSMSFIAAWLYYPYYNGFNFLTLLADWLKLVCFNFPFALLTQLFLIQPIVRKIFSLIFLKGKPKKQHS